MQFKLPLKKTYLTALVLVSGIVITIFFLILNDKKLDELNTKIERKELLRFDSPVILLFFGYTNCPKVCPDKLTKLARIQNITDADSKWLKVVFVDLTYANYNDALAFAKAFHQTFDAITLDQKNTEEFTRLFSVYFAKSMTNKNELDHTDFVYALKRENGGYTLKKCFQSIDNAEGLSLELKRVMEAK